MSYSGSPNYSPFHFFSTGKIGAAAIQNILQRNNMEISDFATILDFGCGCGRTARHWEAIRGVEIFGTDINPDLIEWSRKNLPFGHFSVNNLESELDYPDEYFDFVYAIAVFGHLREELQKHWIRELSRVLKPGGILLVTVKGSNRINELTEVESTQFRSGEFVVVEPEFSGTNYCLAYDPDRYFRKVLAAEAGMEVFYYEESGSTDTYQDVYLLK